MGSLYERVGGEAGLLAAVDLFYRKVLADDTTSSFFSSLDLDAQIAKQVSFMAHAFNGPGEYKGRDLRTAHAELVKSKGLSDVHFDAIMRHLEATLRELALPAETIQQVLAIVDGTRPEVLGR